MPVCAWPGCRHLGAKHGADFESKIAFLLNPRLLGCMGPEPVRMLAPCFTRREWQAGQCCVLQGGPADTIIIIASGQAAVLVDMRHDAASGLSPETDPKRCKKASGSVWPVQGSKHRATGLDHRFFLR